MNTYHFLFQKEILDICSFVVLRSILRGHAQDEHEYSFITKNPDDFINKFNTSKDLLRIIFRDWEKEQQNIQKQCNLKKASENEIRLNQTPCVRKDVASDEQ
ncbi:MAG: hypothetical protein HQK63_17375 [Desulfamplus sp.]|nr:hypothetical protein [Desulfamplus sp.]